MAKNVRSAVEEIARPIVESMGLIYIDTEYAKPVSYTHLK